MPLDRPAAGSAADWIMRARGDLAIASAPLPEGAFYEDLCFHAQQAAEKALKAVYQHLGWVFRYTHDLDELIRGLKKTEPLCRGMLQKLTHSQVLLGRQDIQALTNP